MVKLVVLGWVALLAVAARAQTESIRAEVILHLEVDGNIPVADVAVSKTHTAAVLLTAGIRVRWESAGNRARLAHGTCSGAVIDDIDILVMERAPKGEHPGALGYALPFARSGVRVVIYYDRVAAMLPKPKPYLLGYAVAHEVGHMLIGTLSHADSGVMRSRWAGLDYSRMEAHVLSFTAGDVDGIYRHIRQIEHACMVSGSHVPTGAEIHPTSAFVTGH